MCSTCNDIYLRGHALKRDVNQGIAEKHEELLILDPDEESVCTRTDSEATWSPSRRTRLHLISPTEQYLDSCASCHVYPRVVEVVKNS